MAYIHGRSNPTMLTVIKIKRFTIRFSPLPFLSILHCTIEYLKESQALSHSFSHSWSITQALLLVPLCRDGLSVYMDLSKLTNPHLTITTCSRKLPLVLMSFHSFAKAIVSGSPPAHKSSGLSPVWCLHKLSDLSPPVWDTLVVYVSCNN